MKHPFKSMVIAITGDFGKTRGMEKIRTWIQANGGVFSYDINAQVTHLVCSKEHFKKDRQFVKAAREREKIKIVSFDWLEDSLLAARPLAERKYLMGLKVRTQKAEKKKKEEVRETNIKKGLVAFEKTCKEFENEMNSSNYHIYHDESTYKYDVTLARVDLLTNKNERYMLKLYESHDAPRLYGCFEKYSAPGATSTASILAPIGSSFDVAFDHFKKFFRLKTDIDWEDRLEKVTSSKESFTFVRPKDGQSKGILLKDALDGALLDNGAQGPNVEIVVASASKTKQARKKHEVTGFFDLCDDLSD